MKRLLSLLTVLCLLLSMVVPAFAAGGVTITMQPESQTVKKGGKVTFSFRCTGQTAITWYFVNPETGEAVPCSKIGSYFKGVRVSGQNSYNLRLSKVSEDLHGWFFCVKAKGNGRTVQSDYVQLLIKGLPEPSYAPPPKEETKKKTSKKTTTKKTTTKKTTSSSSSDAEGDEGGDDVTIHFEGQFQGVVLKGDGVAVAVGAGGAGEAVSGGCLDGGVLAEEPEGSVGVLHDDGELTLGEGADLDALGGFHAVELENQVGDHELCAGRVVDGVVARQGAGVAGEGELLELGGRVHGDGCHLVGGDGHGGDPRIRKFTKYTTS